MTCDLCGPTPFPVTRRSFAWAGQIRVLVVCTTCADHAQASLARRESLWSIPSPLATDVKEYEVVPGQETKDREAARARLAAQGGKRLNFGRKRVT